MKYFFVSYVFSIEGKGNYAHGECTVQSDDFISRAKLVKDIGETLLAKYPEEKMFVSIINIQKLSKAEFEVWIKKEGDE